MNQFQMYPQRNPSLYYLRNLGHSGHLFEEFRTSGHLFGIFAKILEKNYLGITTEDSTKSPDATLPDSFRRFFQKTPKNLIEILVEKALEFFRKYF